MGDGRTILRGGRLVATGVRTDIEIGGRRIAAVGDVGSGANARVIDLDGAWVAPGFVDLQINGAFGHDFTRDPASMWTVGERLRDHGVTAFLPTLVSTDLESIAVARTVAAAGPPPGYRGAQVWGLHVEGPFLAPERAGAHDATKLRPPHPDLVAGWSPETGVAMATLAPELPGALATIRALVAQGVVVSAGHSAATYDEAIAGFDAGATAVTHLFNAMSGTDHRSPGLATAAVADRRITASLIVDHIHLHPGTTRAAWRALGAERTMLVTDAIAAVDAPDRAGGSTLGSHAVHIGDHGPRLAGGVLAGSLLTLDAAVRNLLDATDSSPAEAVATVTSTPARLLGRRRRIAAGEPADLTIVDADLAVTGTVIGGDFSGRLNERTV